MSCVLILEIGCFDPDFVDPKTSHRMFLSLKRLRARPRSKEADTRLFLCWLRLRHRIDTPSSKRLYPTLDNLQRAIGSEKWSRLCAIEIRWCN